MKEEHVSEALLRLYHRLPSPARLLTANLRGLQLRRLRYGPETKGLIAEALERDTWSATRWNAFRDERLVWLLNRAAKQVPFYRIYWENRRRAGDRSSWERIENWPLLRKETVQQHPHAFVAEDCDLRRMIHSQTSGTTGKPLHLWWTRSVTRSWFALFEARVRRWNQVSIQQPWAMMGGQLIVPVRSDRPPFWLKNYAQNQLYLSSFHLSLRNAPAYAAALAAHGPTHMVSYPSSAATLAQLFLQHGLRVDGMRLLITNADYLHDRQREIIGKALGVHVRNTYAMGEMVGAASECSAGSLHLWPEVGWEELLDGNEQLSRGPGQGHFVFTGLLNSDMPLIRYVVGDSGRFSAPEICSCGRWPARIEAIEGRLSDMIATHDGRRVFWLNSVLYGLPILEAQIVQETINHLRVCYVPTASFCRADAVTLVNRLRERVGCMKIDLEIVNAVERTASGKVRAVVSKLVAHEDE